MPCCYSRRPSPSSLRTSGASASAISGPATAGRVIIRFQVWYSAACHNVKAGQASAEAKQLQLQRASSRCRAASLHRVRVRRGAARRCAALRGAARRCAALTVCDESEREALERLVARHEVRVDRVDRQPQELVALRAVIGVCVPRCVRRSVLRCVHQGVMTGSQRCPASAAALPLAASKLQLGACGSCLGCSAAFGTFSTLAAARSMQQQSGGLLSAPPYLVHKDGACHVADLLLRVPAVKDVRV